MNTLQQACARSRAPRFVLTAFLSAVCVGSPALASEEGARFRDFFGVAQGGFNQEPLLWGKAVSANRYGYLWGREEEVQGSPDPSYIQGLINLRGQIVTAVDLRSLLELPERQPEEVPMNIVVKTQLGAFSLLVDRIGDVLELSDDSFEAPPDNLDGMARELIQRAYKLDGSLLLTMAIEKVVSADVLNRQKAAA